MKTRWRAWLPLLFGLCLFHAGLWWFWHRSSGRSTKPLLAAAHDALQGGDFLAAEALALSALRQSGAEGSTAALLVAAEAAAKLDRLEDAAAYYARVPDRGNAATFRALAARADLLFLLGRFSESETAFRRALEIDPHDEHANRRFAKLLGTLGRRWEARRDLLELVKLQRFTAEDLILLGDYDKVVNDSAAIDKALAAVPDDLSPLLVRAKVAYAQNESPLAVKLLWQVVSSRPGNFEAQALLGELLVEDAAEQAFDEWRKQLPREASGHPGVWFARGYWAEKNGQFEAAARCYWEAIRIEPDHFQANFRIAGVLGKLEDAARRAPFLQRAELLSNLAGSIRPIYDKGIRHSQGLKAASQAEALGRIWEAWAWNALLAHSEDEALAAARNRLRTLLDQKDPPLTLNSSNPALQIDLAHYPLPDWSRCRKMESSDGTGALGTGAAGSALMQAEARFVDSTSAAGIDFSYINGDDPHILGMKHYQTFGGGVAVLDYDGDGWPDLHFTQGGLKPFDDADMTHVDRLYRNLGNGRFADVTFSAGVPDHRYSQGATVGDYDNDGFPDLFISNIGKSRLFRNNGDGTFDDVTQAAGILLDHWSTSSLIADLNGDGFPDIFDVVNLHDRQALDVICQVHSSRLACTLADLDGETDRLLLSLGEGAFRDVTEASGLADIKGKGLGLVAADFDRSGRLSLFIANDGEANYYLVNQTPQRGAMPRFLERGALHGLAYDRDGKTQANMGIAADDCNGDGLLDLYVTTFYDEAKTLRRQEFEQVFVDVTREANLRDSGFHMLGFGTQFLDGELDGLPDLVVTNGHVHDATSIGIPFEMPPQYFRNVGRGRFIEKSAASLGPFFERKYLGRGLARLDWNRDGREDFAVSHIESPAALVTNQTAGAGHFLAVRLVAVSSARDAIGAIATLTAGDFTRVRELTAGDGYYASNQRELVFGLGNRDNIDKLVIRWPSGGDQEFADLQIDREYLLIENRETPVALLFDRPEAVAQPSHRLN